MRIDQLLVEKGLCPGRDRAKELIRSGNVTADGKKVIKPSQDFPFECEISVQGNLLRYVSRGGLKLEKALDYFQIDLAGKTCMDIGASTGGFTDCMLQHGASEVFAVDVGTGQLAQKLREDKRVHSLENTNIRDLDCTPYAGKIDFISVDVSFLSLTFVFGVVKLLLSGQGETVCLVKPQFEAGKGSVGKSGVVKDRKTHERVLKNILIAAGQAGFFPMGLTFSPVKGPEGNIEYLLHLTTGDFGKQVDCDIPRLVENAKKSLA